MYFKRTFLLGALVGIVGICAPLSLFAASETVILTTLTPKTPTAGEPLNIRVKSFILDLDSMTITWYVNKEFIKTGLGETSLQTTTSALGSPMVVDLVILRGDGVRFDKTIKITPIEVDVFWEADTYTPPFYKGKALPTFKSDIRLIALPRTKTSRESPVSYEYEWIADHTKTVAVGLGRNSIITPGTWPRSSQILSVSVKSPTDDSIVGRKDLSIDIIDPEVHFYEYSQLFGIRMNRALVKSYTTNEESIQIRAVPFFSSTKDYARGSLIFSWYLNNRPSATPSQPDLVLLTRNSDEAQNVTMTLDVQNPDKILQVGHGGLNILFEKN